MKVIFMCLYMRVHLCTEQRVNMSVWSVHLKIMSEINGF